MKANPTKLRLSPSLTKVERDRGHFLINQSLTLVGAIRKELERGEFIDANANTMRLRLTLDELEKFLS